MNAFSFSSCSMNEIKEQRRHLDFSIHTKVSKAANIPLIYLDYCAVLDYQKLEILDETINKFHVV